MHSTTMASMSIHCTRVHYRNKHVETCLKFSAKYLDISNTGKIQSDQMKPKLICWDVIAHRDAEETLQTTPKTPYQQYL